MRCSQETARPGEQVAADTSGQKHVGYSNLAENAQYTRKLTGALQAWEWSTHQLNFLRTNLPEISKKLQHVSLWSAVGSEDE